MSAGRPVASASRRMRFSKLSSRERLKRRRAAVPTRAAGWVSTLEPMLFEAPVERAARQPERLGGLAHVAAVAGEGFLDEHPLDLFEGQVLHRRGRGRRRL